MRPTLRALLIRALTDTSLTARAKGVLGYLIVTYPSGIPTTEALAEVLPEGRDAIRKAFRELIERGYLVRYRVPLNQSYRTETQYATQTGFLGPLGTRPPEQCIASKH